MCIQNSLFNTYERGQPQPIHFKWKQCNEILNISKEEYLDSGKLITIDQFCGIQRKAFYVLTVKSLIEVNKTADHLNSLFVLELRHPRLKKINQSSLGL